jgi:hypothetical protein
MVLIFLFAYCDLLQHLKNHCISICILYTLNCSLILSTLVIFIFFHKSYVFFYSILLFFIQQIKKYNFYFSIFIYNLFFLKKKYNIFCILCFVSTVHLCFDSLYTSKNIYIFSNNFIEKQNKYIQKSIHFTYLISPHSHKWI